MVAQGCKNENDGDVNLWGREKPSLTSCVRNLRIRTYCSKDILHPTDTESSDIKLFKLQRLALHMSRTLKQLRCRVTACFRQRQKLVGLVQENPDNVTRYKTRMSFLHQNSAECETVLKSGMDSQRYLLESMVRIQGGKVTEDNVILSEMPNCFQLLRPEDISSFVNLQEMSNSQYIKQRTVEWEVLRSTARVTGSTMNSALGLDTLNRQKQHHYEFVCGHGKYISDPLLKKRLQHGSENEVNIIATLMSLILPSYLPPCFAYFEVGPVVLQHENLKIVVSGDGILRCTNGATCTHFTDHGDRIVALEFKSPYPTSENPNVTVYETPTRYVPQILLEMKAWKSGILSRYLVEYNMDSQNAFSAMKMFGREVQLTLESNGMQDSAEFVKLVKAWHMACDERGLRADVRVRGLFEMHNFLTSNINFWSVPFQSPGRYIKGMTWQTFEAILQSISTRIQLYDYAHGNTYNARSVSTLANESFFADLVRLDKEGKGYPKACNVAKVMGRVVMLNYYKHKRNKNYELRATMKPKYPPYLADDDIERLAAESGQDYNGWYRDHYFDCKDQHKSQRCRRDDITTGLQALRGVSGVRAFFKVNESRILEEVRAGNKPKGFTCD